MELQWRVTQKSNVSSVIWHTMDYLYLFNMLLLRSSWLFIYAYLICSIFVLSSALFEKVCVSLHTSRFVEASPHRFFPLLSSQNTASSYSTAKWAYWNCSYSVSGLSFWIRSKLSASDNSYFSLPSKSLIFLLEDSAWKLAWSLLLMIHLEKSTIPAPNSWNPPH